MDTLTLISIFVLVGIALLIILYPLWQQTRPEVIFQVDRSGQTLEEYQARYQALLAAIKDLMFDHEMGKVSTEDYETLLAKTKLEAAQIRQQIDLLSSTTDSDIVDTGVDTKIETMIAQLRDGNMVENETLLQEVDAELELLKNVQPDTAASVAGLACNACGQSLQPGDAFCSRCGQPVTTPEIEVKPEPGSCPQCGFATQVSDAFCARCGHHLK